MVMKRVFGVNRVRGWISPPMFVNACTMCCVFGHFYVGRCVLKHLPNFSGLVDCKVDHISEEESFYNGLALNWFRLTTVSTGGGVVRYCCVIECDDVSFRSNWMRSL
jgi:hypothetical protein